jgi:hypothetical protein
MSRKRLIVLAATVVAFALAVSAAAAAASPPTVTRVFPNGGPQGGGSEVKVTGTGFTGATAVKFGSSNAASFTVNSATSITAVSPAGTGTVDVTVTTSEGTSVASPADQFSYVAAPTVVTGAASMVLRATATLNGSVNPNGEQVTGCVFEYGTTVSYGSSAPCSPSPGSGESAVAVSAAIAGLSPSTTYHFRIVATNLGGTGLSADEAFTTRLVEELVWYRNGVALEGGALGADVLGWGKLVLETKTMGTMTCLWHFGGEVVNPVVGAGEGRIDGASVYDCKSENCEGALKSKLEIIPEGLNKFGEWEAKITEPEVGIIRLKVGNKTSGSPTQIQFLISCPNTGLGETKTLARGELTPKYKNGTAIGVSPSKMEFGTGSGELELAGVAEGKVNGSLKLMGYETGEVIAAK